ncbi:MAG: peroxiredoxin [Clostridia bacterium]|nr:peroxiredoxin [Clostridia bacterium]
MLPIGTQAPDIALPCQTGETVSLSQFAGKKVVLYFYPKDNTSGCTKQAQGFTALLDEFAAKNAVVIGVSCNSVASHRKFVEKYDLKHILLADEDKQMVQAYDVWHEKTMCGKKYMGIVRSTYLLDENGVIIGAFPKVKAAENPADMLKKL